jgi:hypothetical protein
MFFIHDNVYWLLQGLPYSRGEALVSFIPFRYLCKKGIEYGKTSKEEMG